jgi:hypothetical protein
MRHLVFLAGTALMAMSASAIAQDHGRGHDRGGRQAAERPQEGGQQRARQRNGRIDRADRGPQAARPGHNGRSTEARNVRRAHAPAAPQVRQARREAAQARNAQRVRAERPRQRDVRPERQLRQAMRPERADRRFQDRREARGEAQRAARREMREDRRDWRRFASSSPVRILPDQRRFRGQSFGPRGPSVFGARHGCPPGLARQNDFCLPPGQLRHLQRAAYNVPVRYRYRFTDGDDHFFRYAGDGIVYRYDRDAGFVDRVYPLYATDLLVGTPMPLGYEVYNVPLAYRPYYQDGGDWLYRYDDGAIYRIDEESGLIDSIVALLTGGMGGFGGLGGLGGLGALGIGDPLPAGYDVYNVPFDYRDNYADSDDAWYRYADGSIYQVDPQTQLIEQVISLIA